jgi:mRNA interferase MazF
MTSRGDVWIADLGEGVGFEQAYVRPVVVVSSNYYNESRSGLAIVIPMTTTLRPVATNVPILPPEGGLRKRSMIQVDQIRAISHHSLLDRIGEVEGLTLAKIDHVLRLLLDL